MLIPYLRNEHESYMIYNIKIIIFNNTDVYYNIILCTERLRARACMRELVWVGLVTDGRQVICFKPVQHIVRENM